MTGTGIAALAGYWVLTTGDYAGLAVVANVVLFAGLALAFVVIRQPDQAWLPSVAWCLVAMLFGYRGGSSGDWYWWAFPLDSDVTPARIIFTCAVWGIAALAYSGRPLLAARDPIWAAKLVGGR